MEHESEQKNRPSRKIRLPRASLEQGPTLPRVQWRGSISRSAAKRLLKELSRSAQEG